MDDIDKSFVNGILLGLILMYAITLALSINGISIHDKLITQLEIAQYECGNFDNETGKFQLEQDYLKFRIGQDNEN